MPTPVNRAKIQLVRGSYANILASIADLLDGELCYAKDRNQLYMVEGSTLTPLDYLANTDISEAVQDAIGAAVSGGTGLTSTYNDATGITTIDLDNTAVTPGVYGSGSAIPTITVDQQGRITSVTTNSVATSAGNLTVTADSGTNQIINLDTETFSVSGDTGITTTTTTNGVSVNLDNTAVIPGTYGSSTAIPSIVVDQQGRITEISTTNVETSAGNLTVVADVGDNEIVNLDTESLTISGFTGVTTVTTTNGVIIDLNDTTVTPGSYGSSTEIPTFTVDQQGRLTAAGTTPISGGALSDLIIAADAGTSEAITLGSETLTISGDTGITTTTVANGISIDLDDTNVTPGTYGDANSVAQFTVDQQGRITAASNIDIVVTSADITDFDDAVREVAGIDQTFEPMGHAVRTDSAISFNAATRQFSIAPVGASYDVWCKGVKYTKTGTDTVTLDNTTGLYYIYFDANGALQFRLSYFDWDDDVPTSYIYWNATDGAATYFADERHGITLDWATHEYLHRTRGAVIANGFSISNYTITGDGSIDSHCYIDIAGGTFFDEDLEVTITHSTTPAANSWEQDLSGPALIPVFYQYGQAWTKDVATNFPFKQGMGYPQYNLYTAGTNSWSTVDADANKYIVQFVIATHNLGAPIISVMGQNQYDNIADAEQAAFEDLLLTGFPSLEFRALYKLVYQVGSYANNVNARLRSVIDIRRTDSTSTGGGGVTSDHGNLAGLGDDDHFQYLHVTESRAGITADITTSGTLKTTDTTASTSSTTGALIVSGGVGVGGDVNIAGDLTVGGTTVTLNTETLLVEDKNIELGVVDTPTDTTANSGGITLKGATDKTISWLNSTGAWTFSEHIDIASGKEYHIDGTSVLSSTTLGSSVLSSSLTSVGTITTGTWGATEIAVTKGGTGLTSVAQGAVLVANASNVISALDGGGTSDGYLFYDATTDTISWVTELDGGTY